MKTQNELLKNCYIDCHTSGQSVAFLKLAEEAGVKWLGGQLPTGFCPHSLNGIRIFVVKQVMTHSHIGHDSRDIAAYNLTEVRLVENTVVTYSLEEVLKTQPEQEVITLNGRKYRLVE